MFLPTPTCAAGKRPQRSLVAYGSYLRSLPSANEQGLRMLIGVAVREGAARGVVLTPLFSLYSYHGPVSSSSRSMPGSGLLVLFACVVVAVEALPQACGVVC